MMGYSTNRPFVKVDVTGEVDKRFGEVTSQLAEKAEQIELDNAKTAIENITTGFKTPFVDERFDGQALGVTPIGWTEGTGTIRITGQNIFQGKHAVLVTTDQTDGDDVYLDFDAINVKSTFHFAVKPIDITADAIVYLSNGVRGGTNNAISFKTVNGGNYQIYDGSTWLGTGISITTPIGVNVTLDFSTYAFDININNGTYVNIGISFQAQNSQINRFTVQGQSLSGSYPKEMVFDYIYANRLDSGSKGFLFCDSIGRGTGYGDLNADGSDAFINQYMSLYNPKTVWTRNEDGGGNVGITKWALSELESRIKGMEYCILAFGVHNAKENDRYGMPILNEFLYQYKQLIRETKKLGIEPIGWVQTRRGDTDYETQKSWAIAQRDLCVSEGVRFINAWDALDTLPFDGEFTDQDSSLYHTDLVHPITAGHTNLAEAVYNAIGTV